MYSSDYRASEYAGEKQGKSEKWSEEDKEMLDAMIDIVSNSLYEPLCSREGMLAWLKRIEELNARKEEKK